MEGLNKKQWFQIRCFKNKKKDSLLPLFYSFYKEVDALKVKSRKKSSFEHNSAFLSVGYNIKPMGDLYSNTLSVKEEDQDKTPQ